jgi:hypothetical protein
VNGDEREGWARAITTAGWLALASYFAIMIAQFRGALAVRSSSFEDGVWGQRVEQVSFVALPQNLVVLVPAAIAAVSAIVLMHAAERPPVPWSTQLVRVVAGTSYVVVGLAVLGIIDVFAQTPDRVGGSIALLNRLGGILLAAGIIRVCLESERVATR